VIWTAAKCFRMARGYYEFVTKTECFSARHVSTTVQESSSGYPCENPESHNHDTYITVLRPSVYRTCKYHTCLHGLRLSNRHPRWPEPSHEPSPYARPTLPCLRPRRCPPSTTIIAILLRWQLIGSVTRPVARMATIPRSSIHYRHLLTRRTAPHHRRMARSKPVRWRQHVMPRPPRRTLSHPRMCLTPCLCEARCVARRHFVITWWGSHHW